MPTKLKPEKELEVECPELAIEFLPGKDDIDENVFEITLPKDLEEPDLYYCKESKCLKLMFGIPISK
jgi:hypothetical protein